MFLRLCSRAPRTVSIPLGSRRIAGTGIVRLRVRYWPVSDALDLSRAATGPDTTTLPPCSPAPGPMSTTWSATRMVSSSCSTTITVLPEVPQPEQGLDQLVVVPLVQPDRRLVEDVQHADQPAADLRRQADALGLAAGQGAGRAVEAQVVEADVEQELHAGLDLLEHPVGDEVVPLGQLQVGHEPGGVAQGQVAQLEDVAPGHGDGQALRLEPGAAALRAGHLAHVPLDGLPGVVGVGLGVAAGQPRHHALVVGVVAADPPVAVAVLDVHLLGAGPDTGRPSGRPSSGLATAWMAENDWASATASSTRPKYSPRAPAHGVMAPAVDRQVGVAHHQLGVDLEPGAEAVAVAGRPRTAS